MRRWGLICLVALPMACKPEPLCVPGQSVACVGVGGCPGGQRCNAEGTAFEACDCAQTDGGNGDAGTDGGMEDAGTDAGVPCNPLAAPGAQGCGAAEKCTWVTVSESPDLGEISC